MKTQEATLAADLFSSEDDIVRYEMEIARRADALAQESGRLGHDRDREYWERAEQEVFGRIFVLASQP